MLKLAGGALTDSVRSHDFVARLGGDEFAVLISNLAVDSAFAVVDRVRSSVGRGLEMQVTASAGFAMLTRAASAADLFQAADEALLKAKETGRSRTTKSEAMV